MVIKVEVVIIATAADNLVIWHETAFLTAMVCACRLLY